MHVVLSTIPTGALELARLEIDLDRRREIERIATNPLFRP